MFMAMYSSIIVSGPQYLTHIIGSVFGLRVYGPLDASERPIIPKHNLNYSCNSEPAANILRLETQDTSIPPSILFHPISPHPTSIFFLILIRPCTLSVLSLSSPSYLSRSFSPYREISDKENEPVPLFAREQISGIARSWTTTRLEMELLRPGTRLPLKRYIYIVHACVLIDECIGKRDTGTLSLLVACHGKLCKLAGVHSTHRLKREPSLTRGNEI